MVTNRYSSSLEKVACGAFSDISFVSAGKKRGFCQLRSRGKRESERFLGSLEKVACGAFSDISFVSAGKKRGFCQLRRRLF
jgi:hypothetical protein